MNFATCAVCVDCRASVSFDTVWVSDEGSLCSDCCRKRYPERFGQLSPDRCSWHTWERYVGFTHVYDFCTKCGEKRYLNG